MVHSTLIIIITIVQSFSAEISLRTTWLWFLLRFMCMPLPKNFIHIVLAEGLYLNVHILLGSSIPRCTYFSFKVYKVSTT